MVVFRLESKDNKKGEHKQALHIKFVLIYLNSTYSKLIIFID